MTIVHQFAITFMAFFAIMNPIANLPVFISLTNDFSATTIKRIALRSLLIATIIVALFAWGGQAILNVFGINLAALRIVGGLLVGMIGFDTMKAKEVLETLQISRQTLQRWREQGILKARKLPNGRYDWDPESVYAILNKGEQRGTYLYARVSTPKQKADLAHQVENLQTFAMKNRYQINGVFQDIASGISFEKRKEFFKLLDLVLAHKVQRVIITYKDRLSRVGYDLFKYLFAKYHVEVVPEKVVT